MNSLSQILKSLNEVLSHEPHEAGPESKEKESVPSKQQLIDWIRTNYNFEDEKLHTWVEKNGWNIHEVEDMIYELASERVKQIRAGAQIKEEVEWVYKKGKVTVTKLSANEYQLEHKGKMTKGDFRTILNKVLEIVAEGED
jgi:hypothetical protein